MKIYQFLMLIFPALVFISCEDDELLGTKPNNELGDEYIWDLPQKAEGVLMNAYNAIPMFIDNYGGNFLDVATDNAVTNDYGSAVFDLAHGGLTATDQQPVANWSQAYEQINYVNLFFENGLRDDLPYHLDESTSETHKTRLRGEAHFLRAWWLSELLRVYGGVSDDGEALGVPVLTSPVPEDQNITENLERSTYEETTEQIFNDCDSAVKYLPMQYDSGKSPLSSQHIGRATQKAALALKARMATYAASPAYQSETTPDDVVTEKWERAARFCYEAINAGQLGQYSKLRKRDMVGGRLSSTPDEYLFRVFHNTNGMESRNLPPAFLGEGRTNPSQNLVDAFPADNGYPISDSRSNYDPQDPYESRDQRLSLTVYHNGMNVENGGRGLEIFYDRNEESPGKDAPGYFYDNTRTGYYLNKWISSTPDMLDVDNTQNDFHMHPLLRRAEVYLSYAEASNQAVGPEGIVDGCDRSAKSIINEIRQKSGGISDQTYVDEIAAQGKQAFNELILNERRIELAFENHRYFDLRRWKMPLDETIRGVEIEKTGDELVYHGTDPDGEAIEVEERELEGEKYYYTPLPYDELVKSPQMKNNKGW